MSDETLHVVINLVILVTSALAMWLIYRRGSRKWRELIESLKADAKARRVGASRGGEEP